MKRPTPLILSIPEPCAEDWARMTPDGCGRYCAACRKTVVDFTGWTDAAIARYFDGVEDEVCGRFFSLQLDRPLSVPAPQKFSLAQWVAAAGIAAISIVAAGGTARAQAPSATNVVGSKDSSNTASGNVGGIQGIVREKNGELFIGATVIAYENGVIKGGGVTGIDGDFKIAPLKMGTYDIQVTAIGYDTTHQLGIPVSSNLTVISDLALFETADSTNGKQVIGCYNIVVGRLVRYSKPLTREEEPGRGTDFTSQDTERSAH